MRTQYDDVQLLARYPRPVAILIIMILNAWPKIKEIALGVIGIAAFVAICLIGLIIGVIFGPFVPITFVIVCASIAWFYVYYQSIDERLPRREKDKTK